MPPLHSSWISISILSSHLSLGLKVVSFPQVSPAKPCTPLSCLPYVPYMQYFITLLHVEAFLLLAQQPSWTTTHCRPPRLFVQYIRSYPPYLEAFPVSAAWECSILLTATQISWPHFNVETSFSCRADPMHFVQWLFTFLSDVLHIATCLWSVIYSCSKLYNCDITVYVRRTVSFPIRCILYDLIYLFIYRQQRREARFIEREKQISNVDNQRHKENERQTAGRQSYKERSVQIYISMADWQHPLPTHTLSHYTALQCTQQTQK